ncbi:hypothetical protein A2U01_0077800, partial [Trifolium medium]|nr:hypothetical protein [Trifolium medium]
AANPSFRQQYGIDTQELTATP